MADKTAYEHGARDLNPLNGSDPNDAFSQEAAENRKPPLGVGLTEKRSERSENDKSDLTDSKAGTPEANAQGQSEKRHAGGDNDGVSSANPRVLSGDEEEDAAFPYKTKR